MDNKKNIDDLIKQSLDNFELEPKFDSFDSITNRIEQKKRSKKRAIIFWFLSGIGILFLSLGIVIHKQTRTTTLVNHTTSSKTDSNEIRKQVMGKNVEKLTYKSDSANQTITKKEIIYTKPIHENSTAIHPLSIKHRNLSSITTNSLLVKPINNETTNKPYTLDESLVSNTITHIHDTLNLQEPSILAIKEQSFSGLPTDTISSLWSLSIGLNASPVITTYSIKENNRANSIYKQTDNKGKPFSEFYTSEKNKNNPTTIGFKAGFNLTACYNKRWTLETGLGFLQLTSKEFITYFEPANQPPSQVNTVAIGSNQYSADVLPFSTTGLSSVSHEFIITSTKNYVYVPLLVGYNLFTTKKFQIIPQIGTTINISLPSNHLVVESPNNYDYKTNRTTSIIPTINAGIQLGYCFRNKLTIYLKPEYSRFLTSMYTSDYVIHQTANNLGVSFGMSLKIK